jgi:hypothetical protein
VFLFLLVQRSALEYKYVCLKNKDEIWSMEPLYNFKVANAAVLSSWLDFLLDHLFLSFGQSIFRQSIGIPMGANSAVFLANFHLSSHEFDFEDWLVKSNSCPVFLHNIFLIRRFADNLFVPDIPDFSNFMCLDKDSIGGGIYPESFCELNCTYNGSCCNFLYLAISQRF